MRALRRQWVAALVAGGLIFVMGRPDASADSYRSGDYVFEIAGLPLDRVQDEVVNAIRVPLTSRGVGQMVLWSATPCYRVGNARPYAGEVTLSDAIAQLNTRLPYRLGPCMSQDQPAITYYLLGSVVDPADQRELKRRLFPDSRMDCDWQQTGSDSDSGLTTSAVVVARSTAATARQTAACLMRNTAQVLGVGWYTERDPNALTAADDERELSLLSLYIRYRITQELSDLKSLNQVENRIAALVAEMHAAGTHAQLP
jgi:hypothetical protein